MGLCASKFGPPQGLWDVPPADPDGRIRPIRLSLRYYSASAAAGADGQYFREHERWVTTQCRYSDIVGLARALADRPLKVEWRCPLTPVRVLDELAGDEQTDRTLAHSCDMTGPASPRLVEFRGRQDEVVVHAYEALRVVFKLEDCFRKMWLRWDMKVKQLRLLGAYLMSDTPEEGASVRDTTNLDRLVDSVGWKSIAQSVQRLPRHRRAVRILNNRNEVIKSENNNATLWDVGVRHGHFIYVKTAPKPRAEAARRKSVEDALYSNFVDTGHSRLSELHIDNTLSGPGSPLRSPRAWADAEPEVVDTLSVPASPRPPRYGKDGELLPGAAEEMLELEKRQRRLNTFFSVDLSSPISVVRPEE